MSETKFTPAPWSAEEPMEGWLVRANDPNRAGRRFLICDIGPSHRSRADEIQAHANAHLIRAAPELYHIAACWAALDGGSWNIERHAREKAELLADTLAVLAKARGEPTPNQQTSSPAASAAGAGEGDQP